LLVLTTGALSTAYRLAGTATVACSSSAEAETRLREQLQNRFEGVLAVHQPYLDEMPRDLIDELGRLDWVLVVGVPEGLHDRQVEDRRARLLRLLREAVGYEITFEGQGESP
jgi:vacuolar-type H+-ATPase subunit F/Vma7